MATVPVTVILGKVKQEEQVLGSSNDYMSATVACTIVHKGVPTETKVRVKQVTGSEFNAQHAIEVSRPEGYKGPLDYSRFVEVVNEHYKRNIGESGRGFKIAPGAKVTMIGGVSDHKPTKVIIESEDTGHGGW